MVNIQENKMDILAVKDKAVQYVVLLRFDSNQDKVFIPHGVDIVAYNAFNNNHYVKEVYLPESVKTVFKSAFRDCKSLESIYYKRNGVYKRLYKVGQ